MIRFSQYLVYLLYRCLESVIYLLPLGACWRVGTWLGAVAYVALPHYANLAIRNLTIAFGSEKSPGEIRSLARRHFRALGRNLICSIRLTGMPLEQIAERVTYEGIDRMESQIPRGSGVIGALLHMGPWELLSQVPLMKRKHKGSLMYQRLQNPYMDARVRKLRARAGLVAFDRKEGFYKPMSLLKEGGGVGILVDQHAGDSGVWCPFFGRLVSTTNIAALFSIRTKSPIVPVGVYPREVGRWRIVYENPVGGAGHSEGDDASGRLAAEMNQVVEKMIRVAPEEWFWVHNRWKTPKPNFLLARYKRGVEFPNDFDRTESLKPFNMLVRSPNWLGDACMAVPAVRAIKAGRPDARISVLAPEGLAELWERVEEVDAVLTKRDSDSPWSVGKGLRGKQFDAGILFANSLRTALEMRLAGISRIVGYEGHYRRFLIHQIVAGRKTPGPTEHHSRHYLRITESIGAGAEHVEAAIAASARSLRGATGGEGDEKGMKLGLCAGARYGPAKQWPLERFAAAAEKVRARAGCEWILFGAPADVDDGQKLARLMRGNCLNLVGKTSMAELMKRLGECRLLLTNDTGTMHLADFMGVRSVAVFGSTDPARTGPMGEGHRIVRHHVECSPCFLRECPIDLRCMNEVQTGEVVEAVLELIGVGVEAS